jgi:hypothetical protein
MKLHHCIFDIEEHDIEDSSISQLKSTILGYTSPVHFSLSINLRYWDTTISKVETSISKFLQYHTASILKPQSFNIEVSQNLYLRYRNPKSST